MTTDLAADPGPAANHSRAVDDSPAAAVAFDAVVLGAGISGLVSASILAQQGVGRVLVVDQYPRVGGNHIDCRYGDYSFDVGSFIFQDDSPLLEHFPELLPYYVPIDPAWEKLTPQGTIAPYPFSIRDDFLWAGVWECLRMLGSVALARATRRPVRNAREFARYWIGARLLYRSGLENYMERFYGRPAEQIDLRFAQKRMQWIPENASVGRFVRAVRSRGSSSMEPAPTNRQLARPKEGFEALYCIAVQRLEGMGVTFVLGAAPRSLSAEGDGFRLSTDDATFTAARVVSTIPVDIALDLCGIPAQRRLPTAVLISLFFSFSGRRGFDHSILYNFSHDGAWKRLTMYSDFYGTAADREYFGVEVIAGGPVESVAAAAEDFRRHTERNRLFDGDLRLEGSHTLDHAYPLYVEGADQWAEAAVGRLRDLGVESFGRQGGFRYQPTARVSTREAEAALAPRGAP